MNHLIRNTLKTSLLSLALFASTAFAQVELPSYADFDVSDYDSKTWVVFDIDNTLLSPTHMIGSHQWGDYRNEIYLKRGYSKEESRKRQHEDFARVAPAVRAKVTEIEIFQVLNELRSQKVPVLTLTARGEDMRRVTMKQLNDLKLTKFNWHSFNFSGGIPKGQFLLDLIAKNKVKPERVIFIDDKDYNVASVVQSMQQAGIEFTAYRYGGVDHELDAFDSRVAEAQYDWFLSTGYIYSDESVRCALQIETPSDVCYPY
jgi:phosphoglycolate phosphatase-like HAD superfamily hydrolase